MRISFVDFQLDLNGSGGTAYSLNLYASELARRGHEVKAITLFPERNTGISTKLPYEVIEENVFVRNPAGLDLLIAGVLKKHEDGTDLFHLHDCGLAAGGGLYRKLGGTKPVSQDLNGYFFCTNYSLMNGSCHRSCNIAWRILHAKENLATKIFSSPIRAYQDAGLRFARLIDSFVAVSPFVQRVYSEWGLPA